MRPLLLGDEEGFKRGLLKNNRKREEKKELGNREINSGNVEKQIRHTITQALIDIGDSNSVVPTNFFKKIPFNEIKEIYLYIVPVFKSAFAKSIFLKGQFLVPIKLANGLYTPLVA